MFYHSLHCAFIRITNKLPEQTISRIITNTLLIGSSRFIARILLAVAGIVLANVLGPERLGLLTIPMLVVMYAIFTNLGVVDVLMKELPQLAGKGDRDTWQDYVSVSATFLSLLAVLITTGLIVIRGLVPTFITPDPLLYLFIVVTVPIVFWHRLYTTIATAEQKFQDLSRLTILQALVRAAILLSLLYLLAERWKLYAQPLAVFFSALVAIWLYQRIIRLRVNWRFSWPVLQYLIRTGLPIGAYGFLIIAFTNGDTFLISHQVDLASLGYFQIVNLARDTMVMIGGAIGTVVLPAYGWDKGSRNDPAYLTEKVTNHYFHFALISGLLFSLVYHLLPWGLALFMPAYTEAAVLLQRMVLAILPFVITLILSAYLIVQARQNRVVLYQLLALAVMFALDLLLVREPAQLGRTAGIAALGYLIYYLLIYGEFSRVSETGWQTLMLLPLGVLPWLTVFLASWLLPRIPLAQALLQLSIQGLVFYLLLFTPLRPSGIYPLKRLWGKRD